jgi:PDZ domain-containing protein
MQKKFRRRLGLVLASISALIMVWGFTQDLPYVIETPGKVFNVLGDFQGQTIVTVANAPAVDNPGRLDLLTISVWGTPGNTPKFLELIGPFFSKDKSITPIEEFYPLNQKPGKAEALAKKDFHDSESAAIQAAKLYLPKDVAQNLNVHLSLEGIGGPSGGLMFTLGIIDKALPQSLTGGKNIAGTGTISPDGKVGPIGGIAFKMISASRAGDSFFLAPKENCSEVVGHIPAGLQVLAVSNVGDALKALDAIANDGNLGELPVCSAK